MEFLTGIADIIRDVITAIPTVINTFTTGVQSIGGFYPVLRNMWSLFPSTITSVCLGIIAVSIFASLLLSLLKRV